MLFFTRNFLESKYVDKYLKCLRYKDVEIIKGNNFSSTILIKIFESFLQIL